MSESFNALQIADNVYWVGAIDWDVRNFHGYLTGRGTTYNAYLVLDEKITLIDTVKAPFLDEMIARVASVIDPVTVDYLVSNHAEMDHSGGIPRACGMLDPEQVFASKMGKKALSEHFRPGRDITVVGDGETLDLGGGKLSFAETRMCHWPDSMVAYLHGAEILFSQDAFGMHLASSERFADQVDRPVIEYEAAKYYANILMPLANPVSRALEKLTALGLPLTMVAPDHGPIWRRSGDIRYIIDSYGRWTKQAPAKKAVVVYDTMWNSTATMARAVCEGLSGCGIAVRGMSMDASHRSDVATELLEAGGFAVGSPTMNNNIFPTVADVMTYVRGLQPRHLAAAAFGSYGWSGEAPRQLHDMLGEMELDAVSEPLLVKYVPDDEALAACRELGETIARQIMNAVENGPG